MRYIADLHLHSRFSRACSKSLTVESIAEMAKIKGIQIVGTADFTHPVWFKELQEQLIEAEPGLYRLRSGKNDVRFLCSTELSCIYSRGGKTRRVHLVILAPSLEVVAEINAWLTKSGAKLKSDGRPILGMDSEVLLRGLLEINKDIVLIPAHAWTPWFAIFGSKSGFDSVEECFGDLSDEIFALETGLSSDPLMNRRMSDLDKYALVSFSDAHSAENLGREATVFDLDKISYSEIISAIRDKDPKRFLYTIEMDPGEGMYMADGHRVCGFSSNPKETKKLKGICPICKKPLVIGVASQIDDRADRELGDYPKKAIPFKHVIPLREIISDALGVGKHSKSVDLWYKKLIEIAGSEFGLLLDFDLTKIDSGAPAIIIEGIKRMREGKVKVAPGFDGQYGVVKIFSDDERIEKKQRSMF